MDDLLRDFLAETAEHVETVQAQLVRFEQDPSDARIVANVFRLVHTIKGACGFLDLRRLEAVSHAAETLIDRLRDGVAPTREAVTLVLAAVDRLRQILDRIAASGAEPPGDDAALIAEIERCANVGPAPEPGPRPRRRDAAEFAPGPAPPERRFETVRVSSRSLERLDALAAELTVSRDEVAAAGVGGAPLRTLSTVARDFQSTMLSVRLQP
ncbi:MAG: Hpt domain-containing protein, partial [Hyphomicrobiales bacterium]|nr:Hpt domain-containing protein [Hyphomicrobiales bacterium]